MASAMGLRQELPRQTKSTRNLCSDFTEAEFLQEEIKSKVRCPLPTVVHVCYLVRTKLWFLSSDLIRSFFRVIPICIYSHCNRVCPNHRSTVDTALAAARRSRPAERGIRQGNGEMRGMPLTAAVLYCPRI